MSESLLSHFTKKQSGGFAHFHERISLSLTKHEQFAQKHLYFFIFFLCPKQIAPVTLYKRVTFRGERFTIFQKQIAISLFGSQKTSNSHEKPKSEFPTLFTVFGVKYTR